MYNFEYYMPTKVIFGKGKEALIGEEARAFGTRVLLHYGGGSVKKTGLFDRVKGYLEQAGLTVFELGGVLPNPRVSLCREGIRICRENGIDAIVALGGGSVIDSAKCISFGVPYEGDPWEMCVGAPVPKNNVPLLTIVTMAGAGSEVSQGAVITNEDGWLKRGFGGNYVRPNVSIINPELTYTLPPYQVAAGCVDIMSHALERILADKLESEVTERWCADTVATVIKYTPKALATPDDYDVRATISWAAALVMAGTQHAGIQTDGVLHGSEHELSAIYDVTHGAGLAVMILAYFRYLKPIKTERLAKIMQWVFHLEYDFANPAETVEAGIERMEDFFRRIGMPTTLPELGIDESRLTEMAEKAVLNGPLGHFYPMDAKQVEDMYRLAL